MIYNISFCIEKPDGATEKEFKEWVECELYQESIPDSNTLEYKVFETSICNLKIDPIIDGDENSCSGCEYLGSDSCRDAVWYVCDHPNFEKEYPEGKTLNTDFKTEIPSWCQKKE